MVSGTLTHDGGVAFPGVGLTTPVGYLDLQTAAGDKLVLGNTALGMYTRYVIPGTYELIYSLHSAGFGIPSNTAADLGCYGVP
jgi:hypothetical protein